MSSFIVDLWESIFTPGPTPSILKATNASFAALQVVLLSLLYATYSVHFVVLSALCAALWWSINWFAAELKLAQQRAAAEEDEASKKRDAVAAASASASSTAAAAAGAGAGDSSDTEVEGQTSSSGRVAGGKRARKVAEELGVAASSDLRGPDDAALRQRGTGTGTGTQSSVSTEDEWEKVSENEQEKDK
jgi:hypothetical protein